MLEAFIYGAIVGVAVVAAYFVGFWRGAKYAARTLAKEHGGR